VDYPTLLENDIVITTYATLTMEYTHGRSILHHIHWYRLVLDEGEPFHYLRDVSADGVSHFDSSCYKESFNKTV